MMPATALAILVALTLGGQESAPKPFAPLQGAWVLLSTNGREAPSGGPEAVLTFAGNKWDMKVQDNVAGSGTIKVDASSVPMAIDMLVEVGGPREQGQIQLGIFEISDGRLRLHVGEAGGIVRPTDFTQTGRSGVLILRKK
jgi:uncharacterized protein (TIGR03067 family)